MQRIQLLNDSTTKVNTYFDQFGVMCYALSMLYCWQTYCIIFVVVIVHELLICACIYYGDFMLENS